MCLYIYALLKRPQHETQALIEAAEYVNRDLEYAKRDLEYAKRDLEYAKRDLEYVKRDLPPPSLRPIIPTNASRNSFLSRVSDEECAVRLLGMSQQCAS